MRKIEKGEWVTLKKTYSLGKKIFSITIKVMVVEKARADPARNLVSESSPLGARLLRAWVGEEFELLGSHYKILEILKSERGVKNGQFLKKGRG